MGINDNLRQDIIDFFDNIEGMESNDQVKTLENLINKYAHLNSTTLLLDHRDLQRIIGMSKELMSNSNLKKSFRTSTGNRIVQYEEARILQIICATISFLNSKDCLKKIPKFNYKED